MNSTSNCNYVMHFTDTTKSIKFVSSPNGMLTYLSIFFSCVFDTSNDFMKYTIKNCYFVYHILKLISFLIILLICMDYLLNYFYKDHYSYIKSSQKKSIKFDERIKISRLDEVLFQINYLIIQNKSECYVHCVRLLTHYGHELINVPIPPQNYSAFLRAVWSGPFKLVHFMLRNGANIAAQNCKGESAMYLATFRVSKKTKNNLKMFNEYKPMLNCLYSAGCDINLPNKDGITPLHIAAKEASVNHDLVVKVLEDHERKLVNHFKYDMIDKYK
ncbi:uncharacterized protein LOC142333831 isoform X2 [Lycorma delicatula]|uniref:uncharacterized protein LOC142333831 isoform X2 n=1 Tax=Lycorma delicatula TaxID=130591 RepID=UPI003F50D75C